MNLTPKYSFDLLKLLGKWKKRHKRSPQSPEGLLYVAVRETVSKQLVDKKTAHDPSTLMTSMAPIRRDKLGKHGRYRVVYICNETDLVVLWVGLRARGDRKDVYVEVERKLKAGRFDNAFDELGLEKPSKKKKKPTASTTSASVPKTVKPNT